ncbi:MAG: hypothetical protein ACTSPY_07225 [Candidatus Helarchaeota archaeon]
MKKEAKKLTYYPFGIYFCTCKTLIIWYPDTKNYPKMDYFPEIIECPNCKKSIQPCEKLKINPEKDLVKEFVRVSLNYEFKKLLMIDESHVHFFWNKPNVMN